jgi:hypothetical protein
MKRLFVLVALCAAVGVAQSQQHPPQPSKPVASEAKASQNSGPEASSHQEVSLPLAPGSNLIASNPAQVKSEPVQKSTSEEPSKWSDPITWFTLVIMFANIALWTSTRGLAREAVSAGETAQLAIHLAREEFIAAHGPHIVLRTPVVVEIKGASDVPPEFHILFVLHNAGKGRATVMQSSVEANLIGPQDSRRPFVIDRNDLGSHDFAPGEEKAFEHVLTESARNVVAFNGLRRLHRESIGLFFTVAIRYVDAMGGTRTNYTTRKYDGVSDSFKRTGDPDDEYGG